VSTVISGCTSKSSYCNLCCCGSRFIWVTWLWREDWEDVFKAEVYRKVRVLYLPMQEIGATHQGSTFRNAWKKISILAPFLWPKKDILLQFRVVFCFLLLAAGRVMNLYVPIYSKLIGESKSLCCIQSINLVPWKIGIYECHQFFFFRIPPLWVSFSSSSCN
jgi:hypothetical protein